MTRIFRAEQIKEAAQILRKGGTVIFPTETVYGLGARYDDEKALEKIFTAKGRPKDNPLILHIYKMEQLEGLVREIPEGAKILMERFWPGPLTLIFRKRPEISSIISAGLETVAVRMPSDNLAQRFLREVDLPIAAPSANLSGSPSPTSEDHLMDMMGRVDGILLGGDSSIGLESTVVDMTRTPPLLLRPGKVSLEELEEVLGQVDLYQSNKESYASPGLKYRHYAPQTPVVLLQGSDENLIKFINCNQENCVYVVKELVYRACGEKKCHLFYPKEDIDYAAREYFRLLRTLDNQSYDIIYITEIPILGLGRALMDRILRSSGGHTRRLE
ncbi:MAG: threonylcarbamoyl-AMP synthase [Tissierellia bacterium]|nr:threonylcarbamoyl-AMP synthase [Tissierellia bacterium]